MALGTTTSACVHRYFQAWNDHEPDDVPSAFTDDGTYTDPNVTGPPLSGPALSAYARGMFEGFSDLHFDIVEEATGPAGSTMVRWLMRGTNDGPLRGAPPTHQAVDLPGVDVITSAGGRLTSVEGFFDRQTFAEQLGLQVLVQPYAAGPFCFGYGVRADSPRTEPTRPGAISLTWIEARSPQEADEVRAFSRPLAVELRQRPGFLSWTGVGIGNRLYTITAWEDEQAARQVVREPIHKQAVERFFHDDLGGALHSGLWSVHHLNPVWVRCASCRRVSDTTEADTCGCGNRLPRPSAW
jgi:steroid delta-isomerase-like uncharacterized protein